MLKSAILSIALLTFILPLAANGMGINCSTIVDCRTCTLSTDFLIPCQWCLTTRSCVSAWSVSAQCPEAKRVAHGYNCPLSPPARFNYLDDFARTRALPFIAAASADSDQQIKTCLDNNVANSSLLRRYSIPCDFVKENCAAFLAFSPLDNAIVITFRGTNGPVQLFTEAINFILYAQKDFEPVGGKVVAYFYDAFFQLWKGGLEADLRETISRYPTAELWVFGHSLGGAIGALAAAWTSRMSLVPMEHIRFVSFGQPRTGNVAFAQIFDDLVPYKYRVVHRGDSITKLPARITLSDSSLFHHRYEVWYSNDMLAGEAYEVCESADSASCSASVNDVETLSSAIHLQYFNVSLYSWFRTGCSSNLHLKLRPHLPLFYYHSAHEISRRPIVTATVGTVNNPSGRHFAPRPTTKRPPDQSISQLHASFFNRTIRDNDTVALRDVLNALPARFRGTVNNHWAPYDYDDME